MSGVYMLQAPTDSYQGTTFLLVTGGSRHVSSSVAKPLDIDGWKNVVFFSTFQHQQWLAFCEYAYFQMLHELKTCNQGISQIIESQDPKFTK